MYFHQGLVLFVKRVNHCAKPDRTVSMTSYSTRAIFNDLSDGDQVIIRKGYLDNEFKIVTLKGDQNGRITKAFAEDGKEFEFKTSDGCIKGFQTPHGERWTLYFSYPLPNLTDQEQVAYAKAMLGDAAAYPRQSTSEWDDPVAFLIEDVTGPRVLARMVSHEVGYLNKDRDGVERLTYKTIDEDVLHAVSTAVGSMWTSTSTIELDRASVPAEATSGSMVVASNIDVEIIAGRAVIKLRNPALLPRTSTLEKASELFPSRISGASGKEVFGELNRRITLAPIGHLLYEVELARHALDTDEALVVVFPDPDNPDGSSENIGILTSKGAVFYADTGYAHDQISCHGNFMPGIVHITETRPWSYSTNEGEHESGIDFADVRADEGTLDHFGLDITGLGKLIRAHLDEEDKRFAGLDDSQLGEMLLSLNKSISNVKDAQITSLG
jgi:hypothetical protein